MLCDMRVDDRCQPISGNFFEHILSSNSGSCAGFVEPQQSIRFKFAERALSHIVKPT